MKLSRAQPKRACAMRAARRARRRARAARGIERRELQPFEHEPRALVVRALRDHARHAHRAGLRERGEPVGLGGEHRRAIRLVHLREVAPLPSRLPAISSAVWMHPPPTGSAATSSKRAPVASAIACASARAAGVGAHAARMRASPRSRSAIRSAGSSRPICRRMSGPPFHGRTLRARRAGSPERRGSRSRPSCSRARSSSSAVDERGELRACGTASAPRRRGPWSRGSRASTARARDPSGSAGCSTRFTAGCAREPARDLERARSCWRRRTSSVRMPRSARKMSSGLAVWPRSREASRSRGHHCSFATTAPMSRSEWPRGILGRRLHHEVGAVVERAEEHARGPGVVVDHRGAVRVRHPRDRRESPAPRR